MRTILCTLLLLLISTNAFAHSHVWYDKNAGISSMKKIVVFPLEGIPSYTDAYNALVQTLSGRIKNMHFTMLYQPNSQARILMQSNDRLKSLLKDFPTEEARAQAVQEATVADGYLVCRIREDRTQIDMSPETSTYVTMEDYTEESGGPNGSRRYDDSSYETVHIIPAKPVFLNLLNLDYTLYDHEGKKVMLVQNNMQNYDLSKENLYKELFKEFAKELKNANKDKEKW